MKCCSPLCKKIFAGMVLIGLVPLLVMAVQNHYFARKTIRELEVDHLELALKTRMLWLRTWVSHTRQEIYLTGFHRPDEGQEDPQPASDSAASIRHSIFELFRGHGKFRSLVLYDQQWKVETLLPEALASPPFKPEMAMKTALEAGGLFVSGEPHFDARGDTLITVGHSLGGPGRQRFLVAELNLSKSLQRILSDTSDMSKNGTVLLVSANEKILYQSPQGSQQKDPAMAFSPEILLEPYWKVKPVEDGNGRAVLSVTAPIPEMGWYLVLQLNKEHVFKASRTFVFYGILTALATLCAIIVVVIRFSCQFTRPLEQMAETARQISRGRFQERLPSYSDPLVQDLGGSFNLVLDRLDEYQKRLVQTTSLSRVGRFTSSLIHEMRNPLSSIKINLQALARKVKGDQAYLEMADISLMQIKRLEELFIDMLDFSKPIQLKVEKTFFSALVEEALQVFSGAISGELLGTMSPMAEDKKITFNVTDNLGSKELWLDYEQVSRALINLVGNAIEWSDEGAEIFISGWDIPEKKQFAIQVRDTGRGFSEGQAGKVFDPFYTTRQDGTGLGLANVKKIVEYHGGIVVANNADEGGAEFTMIFMDRKNNEQYSDN